MNLDDIISHLKENNIKNLYTLLLNSKDKKAKVLLYNLQNNQDFYESIGNLYGNMGKTIMVNKSLEGINILGNYLKLNKKIYRKILSAMIYPFILFILQIAIIFLIYHFYPFNLLLLIIPFCLLCYYFLNYYQWIFSQKRKILSLYFFQEFVNNKINYFNLLACLKEINSPYDPCFFGSNIEDLCLHHCFINFISLENFKENYKIAEEELIEKIKTLPKKLQYYFLLFSGLISLIVLYNYFTYLQNIMKSLI